MYVVVFLLIDFHCFDLIVVSIHKDIANYILLTALPKVVTYTILT